MKIGDTGSGFWPVTQRAPGTAKSADAGSNWLEMERAASGTGGASSEPSSSSKLASTLSDLQTRDADPRRNKAKASGQAAEDAFSKWSKLSTPEKIRASVLEKHGYSEEAFREIPPKERKKIEDEIRAAIEGQHGVDGDESSLAA